MFEQLQAIIQDRRANPRPDSYTSSLFEQGLPRTAQKVGEEAVEVVVATLGQGRADQINELADLFFHALVLMNQLDISLVDVEDELRRRHTHAPDDAHTPSDAQ